MPRTTPEQDAADTARWRENNRGAYNDYMRNYRRKEPVGDPDEAKDANPHDPRNPTPHGTAARYQRHKCRCSPCTQAQAEAQKAYRAKKKGRDKESQERSALKPT